MVVHISVPVFLIWTWLLCCKLLVRSIFMECYGLSNLWLYGMVYDMMRCGDVDSGGSEWEGL